MVGDPQKVLVRNIGGGGVEVSARYERIERVRVPMEGPWTEGGREMGEEDIMTSRKGRCGRRVDEGGGAWVEEAAIKGGKQWGKLFTVLARSRSR